jgi:hypothetical protein
MTTPTIREIKRYFEMYPERYQAFRRKSNGLGPRKWVELDVREWATPHGREVWREPQPARLWHWMREVRRTDDWRLLSRMSPEYQSPPPPPAPPGPASASRGGPAEPILDAAGRPVAVSVNVDLDIRP